MVASCGTALTTEQIRATKRHSQNLCLNSTPTPRARTPSSVPLNCCSMKMCVCGSWELEGGLYPDEYCKQHGAEADLSECFHLCENYHNSPESGFLSCNNNNLLLLKKRSLHSGTMLSKLIDHPGLTSVAEDNFEAVDSLALCQSRTGANTVRRRH